MNLLKGTKCYTIGNLEYSCFSNAKKWRSSLKQELKPLGITILSPLDKVFKNFPVEGKDFNAHLKEQLKLNNFDYVHEQMKHIRNRDLGMVDLSTFIIGVLNPDVPTFGTTDEIVTAKRNQKPVFLVIPERGYSGCPLWLTSYFKPNWVYKDLITSFQNGNTIILMSGRPDHTFSDTQEWLEKFNVPYHYLFMRASGDSRSDVIVKNEFVSKIPKEQIICVHDDRPCVIREVWQAAGIKNIVDCGNGCGEF